MDSHSDVLISIRPKHADKIFNGSKTVELRRRKPKIATGARIWIYATRPTAALRGCATLDRVETAAPSVIWEKFRRHVSVSKDDFDKYFSGQSIAHALILSEVQELENPILLTSMKKIVRGFHPPQFFCHLNGAVADLRLNSRKLNKRKPQ